MDAALCVPPAAGATAGATVCANAGVAAAIANAANKRKSRRRYSWSPPGCGAPVLIRVARDFYTRLSHPGAAFDSISRSSFFGSRYRFARAGHRTNVKARLDSGGVGSYLSVRRNRVERDGDCEAAETDRWTS